MCVRVFTVGAGLWWVTDWEWQMHCRSNSANRSLTIDSKWVLAEYVFQWRHTMRLGPKSMGNLQQFRKFPWISQNLFAFAFNPGGTAFPVIPVQHHVIWHSIRIHTHDSNGSPFLNSQFCPSLILVNAAGVVNLYRSVLYCDPLAWEDDLYC